jgi:hypothetical protein
VAEYHVGCGAFGIYAGTLNKHKTMWQNKSDVTEEARQAVIQYEKDRLKISKRVQETVKYTFKNGDVLTVTYKLKKAKMDAGQEE